MSAWAVFYVDMGGEGLCETYDTWRAAQETLHGFIDMVSPVRSRETFHRELSFARENRQVHITDGVYSFAIEAV